MNKLTQAYCKYVLKGKDLKKFEQIKRLKQYQGQKLEPVKFIIKAHSRQEAVAVANNATIPLQFVKKLPKKVFTEYNVMNSE